MAIGDIIEARFACYLAGQAGFNVRHYRQVSGPIPRVSALGAASILDASFNGPYKALLSTPAEWIGVGVRHIFPGVPSPETPYTLSRGPGTAGEVPLPTQTCGIVTLRTEVGGRSARGRAYLPFPSELDNEQPGQPTVGYLDRLNDIGLIMASTFEVGPPGDAWLFEPVVWSRLNTFSYTITNISTRSSWATQRRRGQFGSGNPVPWS